MEQKVNCYIKKTAAAVSGLEKLTPKIVKAAELIIDSYKKGGKLIIFGNGGSAADSQHIATELVSRFTRERAPVPAVALTTNTSMLTAIANDYSFREIFSRQLEAIASPGDSVLAISTSGKSANVLKGIEAAREKDLPIIGFTSRSGGDMTDKCSIIIKAPSDTTSRVQECHITAAHIICELVEETLFG